MLSQKSIRVQSIAAAFSLFQACGSSQQNIVQETGSVAIENDAKKNQIPQNERDQSRHKPETANGSPDSQSLSTPAEVQTANRLKTDAQFPQEAEEPGVILPKVRFPAALVIEGGKSDAPVYSFAIGQGTKTPPLWRQYVCLRETEEPIEKKIELNLENLGTPVVLKWFDSTNQQANEIVKLSRVVMSIKYTTKIYQSADKSFAVGQVSFKSTSEQDWSYLLEPEKRQFSREFAPLRNFFDLNLSDGAYAAIHNFRIDGQNYYIRMTMDKFSFWKESRTVRTIDDCERSDSTQIVLQ